MERLDCYCVELAVRGLKVYFHGSEGRLLQAARGDRLDGLGAEIVLKKAKKGKRLQDWEEKAFVVSTCNKLKK